MTSPKNYFDPNRSIFIHGLQGNSQGIKSTLLRGMFPTMLTPDFVGPLDERVSLLELILAEKDNWTIIGSSLGGLMAAIFTSSHPQQVRKQILLAPALIWPGFSETLPDPIDTPTLIIHGTKDQLVPIEPVQLIARKIFLSLEFHPVDDDHGLYQTVHTLDWHKLLA